MPGFDDMSTPELEKKITELRDLLEEVIEERGIILGQRNLHLSSRLVIKYANEIDEIKAKIKAAEETLAQKKG